MLGSDLIKLIESYGPDRKVSLVVKVSNIKETLDLGLTGPTTYYCDEIVVGISHQGIITIRPTEELG